MLSYYDLEIRILYALTKYHVKDGTGFLPFHTVNH